LLGMSLFGGISLESEHMAGSQEAGEAAPLPVTIEIISPDSDLDEMPVEAPS